MVYPVQNTETLVYIHSTNWEKGRKNYREKREESHAERHPIIYRVSIHLKTVFFSKFYLPIKEYINIDQKQIREK